MSKIEPIGEIILIKSLDQTATSASGLKSIKVPERYKGVIECLPYVHDILEEGDVVYFDPESSLEVQKEGQTYFFVESHNIFGRDK